MEPVTDAADTAVDVMSCGRSISAEEETVTTLAGTSCGDCICVKTGSLGEASEGSVGDWEGCGGGSGGRELEASGRGGAGAPTYAERKVKSGSCGSVCWRVALADS